MESVRTQCHWQGKEIADCISHASLLLLLLLLLLLQMCGTGTQHISIT